MSLLSALNLARARAESSLTEQAIERVRYGRSYDVHVARLAAPGRVVAYVMPDGTVEYAS